MKDQNGFVQKGCWYKGNLHSHTTNSDGGLTPNEAVKLYAEHGYHFLCLSEHDLYTDLREEFNTEDFILIPGVEASAILYEKAPSMNRIQLHHMHGILGTKEMQEQATQGIFKHKERLNIPQYYGEWDSAKVANKLSEYLQEKGCVVTYNHPVWSRVCHEDYINTKGITCIEIYNHGTVFESGTGYDTSGWDAMLKEGKRVHAFASDDNHNEGLFNDSCGGYIMVQAEELSHDNIVTEIMAGNYYSTMGPEILDWGIKDGVVYVECSPVNRINFLCGNYVNAGMTVFKEDIEETITHGEFTLRGNESYVRVECIDKYGKTAWTNALFL